MSALPTYRLGFRLRFATGHAEAPGIAFCIRPTLCQWDGVVTHHTLKRCHDIAHGAVPTLLDVEALPCGL